MNNCAFKGRLTADPELKQTQSGVSVCRFRIAVNRNFKNQDGSYDADFIPCTAWKATAELVSKYFTKGQEIIVIGDLRNADYTDSNGVKHYAMDINVSGVEFCGSKGDNGNRQASAPTPPPRSQAPANMDLDGFEEILSDGDVPF